MRREETVVENQLRTLDQELSQAVARRDTTALGHVIADDYTFTSPVGDVTHKSLPMARIAARLALKSIIIDDVTVHVYGNTASVSGHAAIQGRYKRRDLGGRYRYSDVYMMRQGRSQIVATQAVRVSAQ